MCQNWCQNLWHSAHIGSISASNSCDFYHTRLSKALFVACLLQCIGGDKLKTKLSFYDDDVLGTLLSEVEDSGLPRDFRHESCQISGEVVKDLAM